MIPMKMIQIMDLYKETITQHAVTQNINRDSQIDLDCILIYFQLFELVKNVYSCRFSLVGNSI